MESFLKEHWKLIALIMAGLWWLSVCLECYCDRRDGVERPGTDTIDMGD